MRKSFQRLFGLGILLGSFVGCSLLQQTPSTGRREVRDRQNTTDSAASASGPRKRLGVLPFLDFGGRPESIKNESQVRFIEELNREGQLLGFLINREDMSQCPIQNEQYDLRGCARDSQKFGYQAIVEGKILDFRVRREADSVGLVRKVKTSFEAVLRLRVYSVRGQKEVFNTDKTVTYSLDGVRVGERVTADQVLENNPQMVEKVIVEGFLEYIPQIQKILSKMNWEGRIAAIQGQKIYLNVGSLSGVQVGDLLRVYEEGPEIYDPEMGTAIGKAPGGVKGTLEIVSYFGNDGAVAVIHSGGGFKENDRVELY